LPYLGSAEPEPFPGPSGWSLDSPEEAGAPGVAGDIQDWDEEPCDLDPSGTSGDAMGATLEPQEGDRGPLEPSPPDECVETTGPAGEKQRGISGPTNANPDPAMEGGRIFPSDPDWWRFLRLPTRLALVPVADLPLDPYLVSALAAWEVDRLGQLDGPDGCYVLDRLPASIRERCLESIWGFASNSVAAGPEPLCRAAGPGFRWAPDPWTRFLSDLGLSLRSYFVLDELGFKVVSDLASVTPDALADLGLGDGGIAELVYCLVEDGFSPEEVFLAERHLPPAEAIGVILAQVSVPTTVFALLARARQLASCAGVGDEALLAELACAGGQEVIPGHWLPETEATASRVADALEQILTDARVPLSAQALVLKASKLLAGLGERAVQTLLLSDPRFRRAGGGFGLAEWSDSRPPVSQLARWQFDPDSHPDKALVIRLPAQPATGNDHRWLIRDKDLRVTTLPCEVEGGRTAEVQFPTSGDGAWEVSFCHGGAVFWRQVIALAPDRPAFFYPANGEVAQKAQARRLVLLPAGWELLEGNTVQDLGCFAGRRAYEALISPDVPLVMAGPGGRCWRSEQPLLALGPEGLLDAMLRPRDGVPVYRTWPRILVGRGWRGQLSLEEESPGRKARILRSPDALGELPALPGTYSVAAGTGRNRGCVTFRLWPDVAIRNTPGGTTFEASLPHGFGLDASDGAFAERAGATWRIQLAGQACEGLIAIRPATEPPVYFAFRPALTRWRLDLPLRPGVWTHSKLECHAARAGEAVLTIRLGDMGQPVALAVLKADRRPLSVRLLDGRRDHAIRLAEWASLPEAGGEALVVLYAAGRRQPVLAMRHGWWPTDLRAVPGELTVSPGRLTWLDREKSPATRQVSIHSLSSPWLPPAELPIGPGESAAEVPFGGWCAIHCQASGEAPSFYDEPAVEPGLSRIIRIPGPEPEWETGWERSVAEHADLALSERGRPLPDPPEPAPTDFDRALLGAFRIVTAHRVPLSLRQYWCRILARLPLDRVFAVERSAEAFWLLAGAGQGWDLERLVGPKSRRLVAGLSDDDWHVAWSPLFTGTLGAGRPRALAAALERLALHGMPEAILDLHRTLGSRPTFRWEAEIWVRRYRRVLVARNQDLHAGLVGVVGGTPFTDELAALPYCLMATAGLERTRASRGQSRDPELAAIAAEAFAILGEVYLLALWACHMRIPATAPSIASLVVANGRSPTPLPSFEPDPGRDSDVALSARRIAALERIARRLENMAAWGAGRVTGAIDRLAAL